MTFAYWILGIIGYVGLACLAGRWIGGPRSKQTGQQPDHQHHQNHNHQHPFNTHISLAYPPGCQSTPDSKQHAGANYEPTS